MGGACAKLPSDGDQRKNGGSRRDSNLHHHPPCCRRCRVALPMSYHCATALFYMKKGDFAPIYTNQQLIDENKTKVKKPKGKNKTKIKVRERERRGEDCWARRRVFYASRRRPTPPDAGSFTPPDAGSFTPPDARRVFHAARLGGLLRQTWTSTFGFDLVVFLKILINC